MSIDLHKLTAADLAGWGEGEYLPGDIMPTGPAPPEPPGTFTPGMHTYQSTNTGPMQQGAPRLDVVDALCDCPDASLCKEDCVQAGKRLDTILSERGERYGAFKDNALVAQQIKHALILGKGINFLADDQLEALHQIAAKISRIVTGDADYVDNWDDIAGYARLVADRIRGDDS